MIELLRRHREKLYLSGDMLFSILVFPCGLLFFREWFDNPDAGIKPTGLVALYAVMAMMHLFRALRLRPKSRQSFIAHLAYAAVFAACTALLLLVAFTDAVCTALILAFLGCMLSERVRAIVRNHSLWSVVFNAVVILVLLGLCLISSESMTLVIVLTIAPYTALLAILKVAFSQIRFDILRDIVRKTYAAQIVFGLGLTMVAFSFVLEYMDDAFKSFWDGLWYCFAVVTTIGFGDITPTGAVGRVITCVLGVYGIIVVALITSVIVNFYGEMKRADPALPAGNNGNNGGESRD